MIKRLLLPFFTLLLFTLLFYRCSDSIIVPGNENNLILNPSFEENGNASLAWWIIAGDTINQIDNPRYDENYNALSALISEYIGRPNFGAVQLTQAYRSEFARHADDWKTY